MLKPRSILVSLTALVIACGLAYGATQSTFFGNVGIPNVVVLDGVTGNPVGSGAGGGGVPSSPYTLTPLGCAQYTSLGTATGLSPPAGATLVALEVETQSVRYRDDGTNPTASVGVLLPVAGPWPYSASLTAFKMIQTTASATVNACFYK